MKILAALASQPGRPLEAVLRSLAPQVDQIAVYLNGYPEVPPIIRELGCLYVRSNVNQGAEKKFHWTNQWDGLYLSCDDDILYAPDYAEVMRKAVERWGGKAVVTAHGRVYQGEVNHWKEASVFVRILETAAKGQWLNLAGTGVSAFDTRLRVPNSWPIKNSTDAQLAVWAQRKRVPMWAVPHDAEWCKYLLPMGAPTIFLEDSALGHSRRNEIMQSRNPWKLYTISRNS